LNNAARVWIQSRWTFVAFGKRAISRRYFESYVVDRRRAVVIKAMLKGKLVVPGSVFGKTRLAGNGVMALVAPVPVSAMGCEGLPGELSLSVTTPFRVPTAVGSNETVIVQFFPALSVVGQPLLIGKSPVLVTLVKLTE